MEINNVANIWNEAIMVVIILMDRTEFEGSMKGKQKEDGKEELLDLYNIAINILNIVISMIERNKVFPIKYLFFTNKLSGCTTTIHLHTDITVKNIVERKENIRERININIHGTPDLQITLFLTKLSW